MIGEIRNVAGRRADDVAEPGLDTAIDHEASAAAGVSEAFHAIDEFDAHRPANVESGPAPQAAASGPDLVAPDTPVPARRSAVGRQPTPSEETTTPAGNAASGHEAKDAAGHIDEATDGTADLDRAKDTGSDQAATSGQATDQAAHIDQADEIDKAVGAEDQSGQRADIDANGNWIPPILRGMAADAKDAKANLPKRRRDG